MNVEILQSQLNQAIKTALRFVANKPSLPILGNIYIEALETGLVLKSSNMETAFEIKIPAKVESGGVLAIPAKLLSEYLQVLPNTKLSLSAQNYTLEIKQDNNSAQINGVDPNDFPTVTPVEYEHELVLSLEKLELLVDKVAFAASTEEARPVLSAILIDVVDDTLKVVATDGFRLSMLYDLTIETPAENDFQVLIPAKVLSEVSKIARDLNLKQLKLQLSPENKTVKFVLEDIVLISRLIDGTFPDYQKIIPKSESFTVTLPKNELGEAVKAASLFARQSGQIVRFLLSADSLTISSQATQVGQQTATIAITGSSENEVLIGFNSRYLHEIIQHTEADSVKMGGNGPLQPVVFHQTDLKFIHVIMPVRLQSQDSD